MIGFTSSQLAQSADAQETAEAAAQAARRPGQTEWLFLSFVHRYFHFDEVVGGEHVRPYELFNALAAMGHEVRVYERHNHDGPVRRFGRLTVRPLPLPSVRVLRRILFWPALYLTLAAELIRARRTGRRLCMYQTLPWGALEWRRLELLPAYVLFRIAPWFGAVTWGAIHDLPFDHFEYGRSLEEQEEKRVEAGDLARRAQDVQVRQVRHAAFVTGVSVTMRDALVERAEVDPEKVDVFRSAVNPVHMDPIPEWQPPSGDRPWRIGFLGHAQDAQLPLLLEAVRLLETDEPVEVLLAGRGTPQFEHGLHVSAYGDVVYKDFAAFARELDLWVIPYGNVAYLRLSWQLKPPMNVASGRPVVMTETEETKHSGLEPYLFLTGTTAESIAARIDDVIRDPQAAKERAEAGREYLLREMTWRKVAERLVERLSIVAGGSRTAARTTARMTARMTAQTTAQSAA